MAVRGSGRSVMDPVQAGTRLRSSESSRSEASVRDAVASATTSQRILVPETQLYRTILACGLDDDSV